MSAKGTPCEDPSDPKEMTYLALHYLVECSKGNRENEKKAIDLLKSAKDMGDSDALGCLGNCYLRGIAVEMNQELGFSMIRTASDEGSASAMMMLGVCYRHGIYVEQEKNREKELFDMAKEKGGEDKRMEVKVHSGFRGDKDIESLQKAADMGETDAIHALAYSYLIGSSGLKRDPIKAAELYKRLADMGYINEIGNTGLAYEKAKDMEKAVHYYERSAYLGSRTGTYRLARFLMEDEKDVPRAIELYKRSSKLGNASAMLELGRYYYHGNFVEKSQPEAIRLWENACQHENDLAKFELGRLYMRSGRYQNQRRAIELLQSSHTREAERYLQSLARRDRPDCFAWMKGRCTFGDRCVYKHDVANFDTAPLCPQFASGRCAYGDRCRFKHDH